MEFSEYELSNRESFIRPDGSFGKIPVFQSSMDVLWETTTYDPSVDVMMGDVSMIPSNSIGYTFGADARGCSSGLLLLNKQCYLFHTSGILVQAELQSMLQSKELQGVLTGGNPKVIQYIENIISGRDVLLRKYPVKNPDEDFNISLVDLDKVTTKYGKPVPKGIYWHIGELG